MDRRTKLLLAVGVVVSPLAFSMITGVVSLGYLYATQPLLADPEVTPVNDTHERVSWETGRPSTGSVSTFVDVRGEASYSIARRAVVNESKRHSVVTDLHTAANLTHDGETFEPEEIGGYSVKVYAWRDGEVEIEEIYRADAANVTFLESGGLEAPERANGSRTAT